MYTLVRYIRLKRSDSPAEDRTAFVAGNLNDGRRQGQSVRLALTGHSSMLLQTITSIGAVAFARPSFTSILEVAIEQAARLSTGADGEDGEYCYRR